MVQSSHPTTLPRMRQRARKRIEMQIVAITSKAMLICLLMGAASRIGALHAFICHACVAIWGVRIGEHSSGFEIRFIQIAPLLVQLDRMQAPVVAVYASSLHKQGKSVSSQDEAGSALVTQVILKRSQCYLTEAGIMERYILRIEEAVQVLVSSCWHRPFHLFVLMRSPPTRASPR